MRELAYSYRYMPGRQVYSLFHKSSHETHCFYILSTPSESINANLIKCYGCYNGTKNWREILAIKHKIFEWIHLLPVIMFFFKLTSFFSLHLGSYMYVDVSQYDAGEKARFQLPAMKENDTHCIDFNYLLTSPDGSSPGTLNILVKVTRIYH